MFLSISLLTLSRAGLMPEDRVGTKLIKDPSCTTGFERLRSRAMLSANTLARMGGTALPTSVTRSLAVPQNRNVSGND
jgi:hypothetical protein